MGFEESRINGVWKRSLTDALNLPIRTEFGGWRHSSSLPRKFSCAYFFEWILDKCLLQIFEGLPSLSLSGFGPHKNQQKEHPLLQMLMMPKGAQKKLMSVITIEWITERILNECLSFSFLFCYSLVIMLAFKTRFLLLLFF